MAETPNIDVLLEWLDQLPEEQVRQQYEDLNRQIQALSAKANALREALELKQRFREWYGPQIERNDPGTRNSDGRPTMREAVLTVMAVDPARHEWSVTDLYTTLVGRDWLDDSNQALRSLSAALSRMTAEGELVRVRRGVYARSADALAAQGLLELGADPG